MKTSIKTMLALMAGALAFTACSDDDAILSENENVTIQHKLTPMTFTANQENGTTRAAIEGVNINWTASDKISVFDGVDDDACGNREFTLSSGAGTASGSFTGEASDEASVYYAMYPFVASTKSVTPVTDELANSIASKYDELAMWLPMMKQDYQDGNLPESQLDEVLSSYNVSSEEDRIILSAYIKGENATIQTGPQLNGSSIEGVAIPSEQTATAGSADPVAMLMMAKSTDKSTFEFKNVCAFVMVKPQFDCASIALVSNGTENLAGTVTVNYNDGNPTTTVTSGGSNKVFLNGTITTGKTYYIAVRPEALSSGFSIVFLSTDRRHSYARSTSHDLGLTRNKITNLGEFSTTGTWTENVVFAGTKARTGGNSDWVQLWSGGPKFATYNVGANAVDQVGSYYAWGETTTKSSYTWDNYTFIQGSFLGTPTKENFKKYNKTDNKATLESADDAATANWGSNWRMPTNEQYAALIANCNQEWTTINGVSGMKFTGKGAYMFSSVFFPAGGYKYATATNTLNYEGNYWTSAIENSTDNECARKMFFSSRDCMNNSCNRYLGCSVRAVLAE